MSELSDVDMAQTQATLVSLQAGRDALIASGGDTTALDSEIAKLQLLLNPLPPPPITPSSQNLPMEWVIDKKQGVKWPAFWYCGGFYAAPAEGSRYWNHFVASVGPDLAIDPTIRKSIPLD